MSKRIIYKKTRKEGLFRSKSVYVSKTTGARYYITIDLNEGTYKIINNNQQRCVATNSDVQRSKNDVVLKRLAKKALLSLGVSLDDEMRVYKRENWSNQHNKGNVEDKYEKVGDIEEGLLKAE